MRPFTKGWVVAGVLVADDTRDGNMVTSSVTNPNVDPVGAPIEVTIFPLDSAGRPIHFGYVSSEDALAAGSSWTFTTTIRSPINNYVAFAVYGYAR